MSIVCRFASRIWTKLFIFLLYAIITGLPVSSQLLPGYRPWCHVIDVKQTFTRSFTAEAALARFSDNGSVSVQLWNASTIDHNYVLLQETQLHTPRAIGRLQVVRLPEKLLVARSSVLGVSTDGGQSMRCVFADSEEGATVYVSRSCLRSVSSNVTTLSNATSGEPVQFLDLALPYRIPLRLCPELDCTETILQLLVDVNELRDLQISREELLELLEYSTPQLTTVTPSQPAANWTVSMNVTTSATNDSVTEWIDANFTLHDQTNLTTTGERFFVGDHNDSAGLEIVSVSTMKPVTLTEDWGRNSSGQGDILRQTEEPGPTESDVQTTEDWLPLPDWLLGNGSFRDLSILEELIKKSKEKHEVIPLPVETTEDWLPLPDWLLGNGSFRDLSILEELIKKSKEKHEVTPPPAPVQTTGHRFTLPHWLFSNGSFRDLSILEELINKNKDKHEVIPPPDHVGGNVRGPAPAVAESHTRYHTVVGMAVWNVVVTMLLFTVIVALFLVCTNNRRLRFRMANSYTVNADDDEARRLTKGSQLA